MLAKDAIEVNARKTVLYLSICRFIQAETINNRISVELDYCWLQGTVNGNGP